MLHINHSEAEHQKQLQGKIFFEELNYRIKHYKEVTDEKYIEAALNDIDTYKSKSIEGLERDINFREDFIIYIADNAENYPIKEEKCLEAIVVAVKAEIKWLLRVIENKAELLEVKKTKSVPVNEHHPQPPLAVTEESKNAAVKEHNIRSLVAEEQEMVKGRYFAASFLLAASVASLGAALFVGLSIMTGGILPAMVIGGLALSATLTTGLAAGAGAAIGGGLLASSFATFGLFEKPKKLDPIVIVDTSEKLSM